MRSPPPPPLGLARPTVRKSRWRVRGGQNVSDHRNSGIYFLPRTEPEGNAFSLPFSDQGASAVLPTAVRRRICESITLLSLSPEKGGTDDHVRESPSAP